MWRTLWRIYVADAAVFARAAIFVSMPLEVLVLAVLGFFVAMLAMPVAAPSISAPASTPADPCPLASTNPLLVDPPALSSLNGELDLTLTLTSEIRNKTQALCWVYNAQVNGKIVQLSVPPTLNVRQGERLSITLVNTLTPPSNTVETPPPLTFSRASSGSKSMGMAAQSDPYALMCHQPQLAPTPTPDPTTGRIYGYHRSPWNEANLHFHGLNTSPNQPSDDVVDVLLCPRALSGPPGVYHYVVGIPSNEPPGTYWYHPHAHGESQYQLFQGLTGAIIVHSVQPSIPDKLLNHFAIVRDLPAHQGIAKYPLHAAVLRGQPNFAQIRAQLALAMPYISRNPGGDPFAPPDQCPGPSIPFNTDNLTINGLALPLSGDTLVGLPAASIGLGETQYWRLANTDAQSTLDVELLVNGKVTPLMVTARDGVPLIVKNGQPTYQAVAMNHVFLAPASRVEFYLTGSVAGADMVVRTLAIDGGCVSDTDLARNLFDVKVGTKHVAQNITVPRPSAGVTQRFSNLAAQTPTNKRTFVLTEYLRSDEAEPDFYITETSNPAAVEHPYRMSGPPDTIVKVGSVEEWTILNYTNEIHGFHIHQIHFMPTAGVTPEEGLNQVVDTVLVPHGGYNSSGKFIPRGIKVLLDFRDRNIIGTFVYHCHFLEHEDNGMMARIQVVP